MLFSGVSERTETPLKYCSRILLGISGITLAYLPIVFFDLGSHLTVLLVCLFSIVQISLHSCKCFSSCCLSICVLFIIFPLFLNHTNLSFTQIRCAKYLMFLDFSHVFLVAFWHNCLCTAYIHTSHSRISYGVMYLSSLFNLVFITAMTHRSTAS